MSGAPPDYTLQAALQAARQKFQAVSETPVLDAQVLLAHILDKPRAWLLTYPEADLNPAQVRQFLQAIQKIETGTPLPYLIGVWPFFRLDFLVSPAVLIPRPETELLVEMALAWLQHHPGPKKGLDIGTGSGCIAVSLAANWPDIHLEAIDISENALAIAQQNAQKHQVADQINFRRSDLLADICAQPGSIDLICANLPYIPSATLKQLAVFGREPTLALDGGPDGLDLIEKVCADAAAILAPGGLLLFEIDATQGKSAIKLARQYYPAAEITLHPDLAGYDRFIAIQT